MRMTCRILTVTLASMGRLDMIEKDLSSIKVDVREIRDALVSAKGGWKMLMAAGALAGAVGSFVITKILPFLSGAPK